MPDTFCTNDKLDKTKVIQVFNDIIDTFCI